MIVPRTPAAPAAVAAHYDALDRWYRQIWGEHVHHGLFTARSDSPESAAERLVDHVAEVGGVSADSVVADIGCGYAAAGRRLTVERRARVIGFTLSEAQAAYARTRSPRVDVRVGDWIANDLSDASCDVAIAIESLSHMPDKLSAFAECAPVLRPGGRLVVCDWLARTERSPWRDRRLLEPICREGRLPSMHTAAEYAGMAREAGLLPRHFEDRSREVSRTWTICLARGARQFMRDPELRRFLVHRDSPDRVFALTMLRILAAYGTRAMVYGILVAERA
jgi:cyclopropane fatty-acyl-phospholipid synthase-like methyltransferase